MCLGYHTKSHMETDLNIVLAGKIQQKICSIKFSSKGMNTRVLKHLMLFKLCMLLIKIKNSTTSKTFGNYTTIILATSYIIIINIKRQYSRMTNHHEFWSQINLCWNSAPSI